MLLNGTNFTHTHNKIRTLDVVNFELIIHMDIYFKVTAYFYIAIPFINGAKCSLLEDEKF
jgi:hypothetical protein